MVQITSFFDHPRPPRGDDAMVHLEAADRHHGLRARYQCDVLSGTKCTHSRNIVELEQSSIDD
jgi:hypothetical protein